MTDAAGDEIGFVSHIFLDVVENKAFLTPKKRGRNEFAARGGNCGGGV
jgi:hypothetical protein